MGSVVSVVDNIIGTDLSGKKAAGAAMGEQSSATREAMTYLNPYREAGLSALAGLQKPEIDVTKDPSYQFRLNEAMKALTAAQSARGGAVSGRAMKELARYSQDYASQEYGKAYDREMGRLSQLTGLGYNAAQGSADMWTNLGQAKAAARMGQAQQENKLVGDIIQGGMAMFSDQNLKENIRQIDTKDLAEMKSFLKAYAFNYKNAEHGKDEWIGVMAQDLEKSKLGKTLVFENAKGEKQINVNKVLSLFLATMAEA